MTVSVNATCLLSRVSEKHKHDFFYLHVVHHHFIGQVRSELGFMDFLVEQRLEKQTPYYRNSMTTSTVLGQLGGHKLYLMFGI